MAPVSDDRVFFLTRSGQIKFPFTPPPLRNHGNFIISLQQFGKWLAGLVEAEGIDMFSGFAATGVLMDGDRVIGVRTGDRGISRHGDRKASYEAGVDIHAKVTILADGVRGNVTKDLLRKMPLGKGNQPQVFALGIKELWDVPAGRVKTGTVMHTMGYPLRHEFGGGFIYAMSATRLSVGFIAGLDYPDPMFDPHVAFQKFKLHPFVKSLLADGQMIRYGAKALPEGGWWSLPECAHNGVLLVGDAAKVQLLGTTLEEGAPRAMAWTAESGKGRAFSTLLGHYTWTFDDPYFRILLLRGMAWAAREPLSRFESAVLDGATLPD